MTENISNLENIIYCMDLTESISRYPKNHCVDYVIKIKGDINILIRYDFTDEFYYVHLVYKEANIIISGYSCYKKYLKAYL